MNEPITQENSSVESLTKAQRVTPLVDIYESEDEVLFVADMPGVEASSLSVNYERGVLTLEGLRELSSSQSFNYFRSFRVPRGVDADEITAELKAGLLQVHLPKAASAKPRNISIQVG